METKPYSLQSPETVAKEYGGNKQKIAEAAQMGVIDPTAAVLAGMFIDRMRAAQTQEQVPQTTVAQQVMGGLPPAPVVPSPPPGGLGNLPQSGPPMAPTDVNAVPIGQPEMQPGESGEIAMAGGGKVHGHLNASDKGSDYGTNISLGDGIEFNLEGAGRHIFDPDILKAILSKKVGGGRAAVRHALRGALYGGDFRQPRETEYEYERPFLGGQLGVHAGASHGFIPDSIRASYSRQFADGGMVSPYASGGLSGLPVPDNMFDEPSNGGFNDGYAGGGIVAFAGAGPVKADPLAWLRAPITSRYGKRAAGMHEGEDFGVGAGTPIGAPAPGKVIKVGSDALNGNFVRVLHPDGTSTSYSHLDKPTVAEGQEVGPGDVLGLSGNTGNVRGQNGGYHLHFGARDAEGNRIDPTQILRSLAKGTASNKWPTAMPDRDINTPEGQIASTEDYFKRLQQRFGPTQEEKDIDAARMARAKEMASDEYYNKQRKSDMWQTLAEIGFNMASSKSPYLLQAIGEAAAAALPGAKADKKDRKALKDRALDVMSEMNGLKRRDNLQLYGVAVDAAKTNLLQKQFERRMGLEEAQLAQQKEYQRRLLEIDEYRAKHPNMSDLESGVNYFLEENPKMSRTQALEKYLELKKKYAPTAAGGALTPQQILEASRTSGTGGGAGGPQEGATAKDSDGKTIVFSNGQWVYP